MRRRELAVAQSLSKKSPPLGGSSHLPRAQPSMGVGGLTHCEPTSPDSVDRILEQAKSDLATTKGFEGPLSDSRSAPSPLLIPSTTPPVDQGLPEAFNQDEDELEMAFLLAFLEPAPSSSHEISLPFEDVVDVPTPRDDDDGGTHSPHPAHLLCLVERRRLFPFTPGVIFKTTPWLWTSART